MNRWIVSICFIFLLGLILVAGCVNVPISPTPTVPTATIKPTATQKPQSAFDLFVTTYDTPEQVAAYMKDHFIYDDSYKDTGGNTRTPDQLLAHNGYGDTDDFLAFFKAFLIKKGGCEKYTNIRSVYFTIEPNDKSKIYDREGYFYHNNIDGNNYYFESHHPFPIINIGNNPETEVPRMEAQRLNGKNIFGVWGNEIGNDVCPRATGKQSVTTATTTSTVRSSQNPIIGTWHCYSGGDELRISFSSSGTTEETAFSSPNVISGTWESLGNNEYLVTHKSGESSVWKYQPYEVRIYEPRSPSIFYTPYSGSMYFT